MGALAMVCTFKGQVQTRTIWVQTRTIWVQTRMHRYKLYLLLGTLNSMTEIQNRKEMQKGAINEQLWTFLSHKNANLQLSSIYCKF